MLKCLAIWNSCVSLDVILFKQIPNKKNTTIKIICNGRWDTSWLSAARWMMLMMLMETKPNERKGKRTKTIQLNYTAAYRRQRSEWKEMKYSNRKVAARKSANEMKYKNHNNNKNNTQPKRHSQKMGTTNSAQLRPSERFNSSELFRELLHWKMKVFFQVYEPLYAYNAIAWSQTSIYMYINSVLRLHAEHCTLNMAVAHSKTNSGKHHRVYCMLVCMCAVIEITEVASLKITVFAAFIQHYCPLVVLFGWNLIYCSLSLSLTNTLIHIPLLVMWCAQCVCFVH